MDSKQSEDRKFARLAIEEARRSVAEDDGRPHPLVGAIVVKNGEVLAIALLTVVKVKGIMRSTLHWKRDCLMLLSQGPPFTLR